MRSRIFVSVILSLVAAVGVGLGVALAANGDNAQTLAQGRAQSYLPETTTTAYRSTLSGDSITDLSGSTLTVSTAAITTFVVGGKANLEVSGRFSSASATATVTVLFYHTTALPTGTLTLQSRKDVLLSASATQRESASGGFLSEGAVVDTRGSLVIKVLTAAPSAGTVTLWLRSY